VKEGETLSPSAYTKRARIQSRDLSDIIDPGRVYDLFGGGATIVLQALHRYWTPLSHFCRDLEAELTHPVQVNVYLTPPVSQGLDIHYDTHDVLVLQVSGVKHWRVWHRAFDAPLAHHKRTGTYEEPGDAQIDVELKPGDCLYIPRGFLHAAQTLDRESAHMTIGILNVTWIDAIARLLPRAESEARFRGSLPAGFAHDPSSVAAGLAEIFEAFADWVREQDVDIMADALVSKFWSSRTPVLSGQLEQILALGSLSDASVVRRRRGAICVLKLVDDKVTVTLGDRRLVMPSLAAPALERVLAKPSFAVGDLAPHLDREGRLVLVRRLIREGLLEQVAGA
jgi:bifunctional lysine-specific demethylase and histidyl-hydroxylase NO66